MSARIPILLFSVLVLAIVAVTTAILWPTAATGHLLPSGLLFLIGIAMAVSGWRQQRTLLTPRVIGGALIAWCFGVTPYLVAIFGHQPAFAWSDATLMDALAPVAWLHLLGICGGLAIARVTTRFLREAPMPPSAGRTWPAWEYRLAPILVAMLITGGLMLIVVVSVGPATFFAPMDSGQDTTFMAGLGLPLWIGSSVILVAALWLLLRLRARERRPGTLMLCAMVVCFVAIQLGLGGLHGSRAATVWAALWFLLMFDVVLRPVRRGEWVMLVAGGLFFAYVYGFYKSVGVEARSALLDAAQRAGISEVYSRSVNDMILGDLSRAGVHALVWQRLRDRQVAELGWGRSYLAAATLWMPAGVIWQRPPTKSVLGASIESDVTLASAQELPSTRQYGISGEAAINVGPAGFVLGALGFVLIIVLLDRAESHAIRRRRPDSLLVTRLGATLLVSVMLSDMDNWLVLLLRLASVLFTIHFALRMGLHPGVRVPMAMQGHTAVDRA